MNAPFLTLAATPVLLGTPLLAQAGEPHNEFLRLIPPREITKEINQWFGNSVSVSGDWLVVGAWLIEPGGAAFFYRRQPGGWELHQALRGQWNSAFGHGVAIDGDIAVLGSANHGDWPNHNAPGEAFVYQLRNGDWRPVQALNPGGLTHYAQFGYAVDIDGDTIVVGAPREDGPIFGGGAVYIYEREASGRWSFAAEFRLPEFDKTLNQDLLLMGTSVAVEGDVVVAGAAHREGGAMVFERDPGTGEWARTALLLAPFADHHDELGTSVDVSGDTIVLGSPGQKQQGSVLVFDKIQGVWIHVQELFASDGFASFNFGDKFGTSVAIAEDRLLVGAGKGKVGDVFPGRAYLFRRSPSGPFEEVCNLSPSDADDFDRHGYSVSLDGGLLVVGAIEAEAATGMPGVVYFYSEDEGQEHCAASPNSTGLSGRLDLHHLGTGALEAIVHQMPAHVPYVLIAAHERGLGFRIDDAHVCLGAEMMRFGPFLTGPTGLGLQVLSEFDTVTSVLSGATLHFQAVFADKGVNPPTLNGTNAVALTLD